MKTFVSMTIVLILMLGGAARADTISLHGSTTVAGTLIVPHQAEIEKAAGVTLEITANGSGNGLADLVAGKAQMAMISAPLEKVAAGLKQKGVSIDESQLHAEEVGKTRVAFIIHPSNPIKSLNFAQLIDVFTGKVTSWKELGGMDKPIVVVVEAKGGGLRSIVEKEMLGDKAEITAEKKEVPGAQLVPKIVSQLDNTLGIAIAAAVDASVVELSTDQKLEQPLFLITKGNPDAAATRLISAAKAAAQ